jgi:hypothetical protein
MVLKLIVSGDEDKNRPRVLIQKLVMIPKAWIPYFLKPQPPWEALQTFKTLLETIPPNLLGDWFNFVEAGLSIACMHKIKKRNWW